MRDSLKRIIELVSRNINTMNRISDEANEFGHDSVNEELQSEWLPNQAMEAEDEIEE